MVNNQTILEKAKRTQYKHKDWYRGTTKSVYDIMLELTKTNDFRIDFPRSYKLMSVSNLQRIGYRGDLNSTSVLNWLIETKQYDKLIIRYTGSEGGTDKGVLKIQTFLILKNRGSNPNG